MVDDISHEGLRVLLREEGVSFQVIKTWKTSTDPDFEAKKNRVVDLYDLVDGRRPPADGDPDVVVCLDEFGPLNLLPRRGHQWAPATVGKGDPASPRRWRRRVTYHRDGGVKHLMAAVDLTRDHMLSRVVDHKDRDAFMSFVGHLRAQYPPGLRIAIVMDDFSPHLSTAVDDRVGRWAETNNVELAYTPTNASWPDRIEGHFAALRYFALDGTDHRSHDEQNTMIRRYIAWRNANTHDGTLRAISMRANVA